MKKIVIIILSILMVLGLAACGSSSTPVDKMRTLVSGNLDAIYKGIISDDYLEVIGSTADVQRDNYIEGLNTEAEFFCYYFDIVDSSYDESFEDLREETRNKIISMYKQIYEKSKYEAKESVKQSDGSYTVQVSIEPIDIMEKAIETLSSGTYEPYNEFSARYEGVDVEAMSDEEFDAFYEAYIDDYTNTIIDCILSLLPSLGYKETKTISVQIQADDEGIYSINDDDWNKMDDYLIYYP
ncbi:MAG: hypothetical protein IJS33_00830 [Firmicutes bacterium]|nr:hypothetical protein [Bacillota bacterium]